MKLISLFTFLFFINNAEATSFVDTLGKKYGKTSGCTKASVINKKKGTNPSSIESNLSKKLNIKKN